MNQVQLIGTLTRDVELKYTQSGTAIASFGVAVNEKRGEKEHTHFFDVTAFGRRAEVVNQYFRKGSRIGITGSLDYQSWEKDGQKKSKIGIKLDNFDFIDRRADNPNSEAYQPPENTPQQPRPPVRHETVPQDYENEDAPGYIPF